MTRVELLAALERAVRHAEQAEAHVARQREIIASAAARGADTGKAEEALRTFVDSQDCDLAEVGRILLALRQAGPCPY
ncbi:MAG: hypothetical protein AB7S92_14880 [Parvibaculaceae bacterium]